MIPRAFLFYFQFIFFSLSIIGDKNWVGKWGSSPTSQTNACTQGPVYLSANRTRFPTTLENGIRTSSFVFRLPTPSEKGNWMSICLFRFPTILKTKFELLFSFFVFPWLRMTFSSYVFVRRWKMEFELRVSFFVSVFQQSCPLSPRKPRKPGRRERDWAIPKLIMRVQSQITRQWNGYLGPTIKSKSRPFNDLFGT